MEASDRKNEVETKTSEIKEIDVNLNESYVNQFVK